MKVLFVTKYGQNCFKDLSFIPRLGDSMDLFYRPYPKVTAVLLFPTLTTLAELGVTDHIDAVITLD